MFWAVQAIIISNTLPTGAQKELGYKPICKQGESSVIECTHACTQSHPTKAIHILGKLHMSTAIHTYIASLYTTIMISYSQPDRQKIHTTDSLWKLCTTLVSQLCSVPYALLHILAHIYIQTSPVRVCPYGLLILQDAHMCIGWTYKTFTI